mgnify:CR=1 FL=1
MIKYRFYSNIIGGFSLKYDFRAWYPLKNKIIYIRDYPHDKWGWFLLDKSLERMQYTGLKDVNGKQIYEGDIVKYSFRDGEHINTRFMQIYNDGVNFKMKELYRNYWLEKVDGVLKVKHGHLKKYKGEVNLLCDVSAILYWYEIVGNIYENPDLLEEMV